MRYCVRVVKYKFKLLLWDPDIYVKYVKKKLAINENSFKIGTHLNRRGTKYFRQNRILQRTKWR